MACLFRLKWEISAWGELRGKVGVVPVRHRIDAHGTQQPTPPGNEGRDYLKMNLVGANTHTHIDDPIRGGIRSMLKMKPWTLFTIIIQFRYSTSEPMHFVTRLQTVADGSAPGGEGKKGSLVGEGGAHMELENRPKTSKRGCKIFAILMETRFELARFPTADGEVPPKHP